MLKILKKNAKEKILSNWKNFVSSKHKYNKRVQNLRIQMLLCLVSIHLRFPLGTVKLCFVSEKVSREDPRTVRFSLSNKILNFRATIVIQIFNILSEKSGQQSTLFNPLASTSAFINLIS